MLKLKSQLPACLLIIMLFLLSSCNIYDYSSGKKAAYENVDLFYQAAGICLKYDLQHPIENKILNEQEVKSIPKEEQEVFKKCINNLVNNIDVEGGDADTGSYEYIVISLWTIGAYQGVIFVPPEFDEEDVTRLLYYRTSESEKDVELIELKDNFYYYFMTGDRVQEELPPHTYPSGKLVWNEK